MHSENSHVIFEKHSINYQEENRDQKYNFFQGHTKCHYFDIVHIYFIKMFYMQERPLIVLSDQIRSDQLLSHVRLFVTP